MKTTITLKDGMSERERKALEAYLEFMDEMDLKFHVYNGDGGPLHPVPDNISDVILDILWAAVGEEEDERSKVD